MKFSTSSIEKFLGKMLLNDNLRVDQAKYINSDNIQDGDLQIIAKEMSQDDFSLEKIYLKYNKQIFLRCTDLISMAAKENK